MVSNFISILVFDFYLVLCYNAIKFTNEGISMSSSSSSSGIGFTGLLTIVFVVLKLMEIITWSWWWVLSPVWITAIFWIVVAGGIIAWLGKYGR